MVDCWLRVILAIRITLPVGLWSIRSLMWRMMRYCSSSVPVGSLKVAPVAGSKVSLGGSTRPSPVSGVSRNWIGCTDDDVVKRGGGRAPGVEPDPPPGQRLIRRAHEEALVERHLDVRTFDVHPDAVRGSRVVSTAIRLGESRELPVHLLDQPSEVALAVHREPVVVVGILVRGRPRRCRRCRGWSRMR